MVYVGQGELVDRRIKHLDSEGKGLNNKIPGCWEKIWVGGITIIADMLSSLTFSITMWQVIFLFYR